MGGAFTGSGPEAFLDGLSHMSAFHFGDGHVCFSNKFMRTKHWKNLVERGERTWCGTAKGDSSTRSSGLVTRLYRALEDKLFGTAPPFTNINNPNVNTWLLSRTADKVRVAASTEADGEVCEFDADTLDTVGGVKALAPPREGDRPSKLVVTNAAHWFFDESQNGGYHVGLDMSYTLALTGPVFTFRYVVWHGDRPPFSRVASIDLGTFPFSSRGTQPLSARAAYMHTVAQTEKHLVLLVGAKRINYQRLIDRQFDKGFFGLFEDTREPVEFIIFSIQRGQLALRGRAKCGAGENFMLWHTANAFDKDNTITVDVTCSSPDVKNHLRRFVIDLEHSLTTSSVPLLGDGWSEVIEFPNVNPRLHLRQHRFTYALRNIFEPTSAVIRLDCVTGEKKILEGVSASEIFTEPVFVSRPHATDETDGVVLTEAIDTILRTSHLLVVDPVTFVVVARVKAPLCGNIGLHSTFLTRGGGHLTSKL
jgi:carotenoid cleavage dioxygenase-like enzyme